MKPEIIAVIDAGCSESGLGSWSVTIHLDGEPAYSAAGSCTCATKAEMEEAAYTTGLRWIAERFPDLSIGLTMDGQDFGQASAAAHLERLAAHPSDEVWPVLMKPQDIVALKKAIDETGKADRTLRGWCRDYGIGRQSSSSAPHEISRPALEMLIHGDMVALELLRAGERKAPRVVRYFRHLGIDP